MVTNMGPFGIPNRLGKLNDSMYEKSLRRLSHEFALKRNSKDACFSHFPTNAGGYAEVESACPAIVCAKKIVQTGRGNDPAQAAISFFSSLISSTSPPATLALKSFSLLADLGSLPWTSLQIPIHLSM